MELKGYEYIPWNDERNKTGGPGYYIQKNLLPMIGKLKLEVPKLHHQKPAGTWDFIMDTAIKYGCKIDTTNQDTRDKAFDKLYRFCYKKLNKTPENQLDLFKGEETCACGKNPSCECK